MELLKRHFCSCKQEICIFPNLKTVALKLTNNNTPIPGKTSSTWLQHHKIARGKADVTLDISMTAENEDFYTMYKDGTKLFH